MARIVLGMGTSHGPMLSTPPEQWGQRVRADRNNQELWFRGRAFDFEALEAARKDDGLDDEYAMEVWRFRHAACRAAMADMARKFRDVAPDVAVIVGNDQREIFGDDIMPAFAVFHGETIENIPATEEQRAMMPPGVAVAERGHHPLEIARYPGLPRLGRHLIGSLMGDEFDVAQLTVLPNSGNPWNSGIPHAYGFVYRQIMGDDPVPSVPVILNTFYPPNQPSAKRCYEFGRAIGRAIRSWEEDLTVAVIASGGLSHFVIDEAFDRAVLDAMRAGDIEILTGFPEPVMQSGTSETKNWIAAFGALEGTGLEMAEVDYVPCYRSEAGTGTAHGFVHWS